MLKFAILAVLFVPPILAALSRANMANALITAGNTGTIEQTFKTFEREQDHSNLSWALRDVAKVQARIPKALACLRTADDPFPKDKSHVNLLVHGTVFEISDNIDTASFTNAITSFNLDDVKLLVSIRYWTLDSDDAVNVLKGIMTKSPELITHDLPSWVAFHSLDRNSTDYRTFREEAFKYLTSFASQSVLEEALTIVKRNEHYKVDSQVMCCMSQDSIPQDLFDKINDLLKLVKVRKALVTELAILPKVLVDLMLGYSTCDIPPNRHTSTPKTSVSVLGKRSLPLQPPTLHNGSKRSK